jgi:hypothetical protein
LSSSSSSLIFAMRFFSMRFTISLSFAPLAS